jgi:hypothetical protein
MVGTCVRRGLLMIDSEMRALEHWLVVERDAAALIASWRTAQIGQQDQVRDPNPTNRAVSIRCRMFSVMSELCQNAKVSQRANVFCSFPDGGHPRGRSVWRNGSAAVSIPDPTSCELPEMPALRQRIRAN